MKIEPAAKPDERTMAKLKKFDDDVMSSLEQFGAIWKPDPRNIIYKTYIFINSSLLTEKNPKKPPIQLSFYCFE